MRRRKQKKGSITDLPFIIAGMFSVAVFAFFVTVVLNDFNEQVQLNDIFPDEAKAASEKMSNDFPEVMDSGIVFLFFGMAAVSLILAALIAVHPIFFPFYLLEYIFLIWISAAISNTYQAFVEHPLFAQEASQFGFTIFFFHYFPFAIGMLGAVIAIVMYKVKQNIITP